MKEKIQKWYNQHLWTANMVQNAVLKNILTQAEANEILGKEDK